MVIDHLAVCLCDLDVRGQTQLLLHGGQGDHRERAGKPVRHIIADDQHRAAAALHGTAVMVAQLGKPDLEPLHRLLWCLLLQYVPPQRFLLGRLFSPGCALLAEQPPFLVDVFIHMRS